MIESLEELASNISKMGGQLHTFYGHNDKVVEGCIKAFDIITNGDTPIYNSSFTIVVSTSAILFCSNRNFYECRFINDWNNDNNKNSIKKVCLNTIT